MKILISILLILISLFGWSQNSDTVFVRYDRGISDSIIYKTDTLIKKTEFGPNFLFETTWLANSNNQIICRNAGIFPDKVASYCFDDKYELRNNRIISQIKTDTSIVVEWELIENCCYSFICDMEIIGDSTINLISYGYGSICGCTCRHRLKYEIKLEFYEPEIKEQFLKLKFISLNNELKSAIKK